MLVDQILADESVHAAGAYVLSLFASITGALLVNDHFVVDSTVVRNLLEAGFAHRHRPITPPGKSDYPVLFLIALCEATVRLMGGTISSETALFIGVRVLNDGRELLETTEEDNGGSLLISSTEFEKRYGFAIRVDRGFVFETDWYEAAKAMIRAESD